MYRFFILSFFVFAFFLIGMPSESVADETDDDLGNITLRQPVKADVVLAIDTAFYGWDHRSESDVSVDALRPFLKHFAEILWTTPGRIRLAVVEMAKEANILLDLNEGINPKIVADVFTEKKERRLSNAERKSTMNIYGMLNLVNISVCNRSDPSTPCILVVVTVALAPVRLPFTGADWPNWRIFGDVMIKSSFDLGVDVMVWTTGYRDWQGGRPAGIVEMSRVEGRIEKDVSAEDPKKTDWRLTYWQAGYDRVQSVDERVAKRSVAVLRRILATGFPDEKPKVVEEKKPVTESPSIRGEWDEWVESDGGKEKQAYDGLRELLYSFSIAGLIGFVLKQGWRLLTGRTEDYWMKRLIKVIIVNFLAVAVVIFCFWVYFWFFG